MVVVVIEVLVSIRRRYIYIWIGFSGGVIAGQVRVKWGGIWGYCYWKYVGYFRWIIYIFYMGLLYGFIGISCRLGKLILMMIAVEVGVVVGSLIVKYYEGGICGR